jgi:putative protease
MNLIELLAPARDLACGKAAIDHGADAVYIGGPSFGARAAAGNSMADIEELAGYAHRYRARLYLTLNTILFDHELEDARRLAAQAWDAGADALIIQDMGLLELELPPLPLIASTQMNNTDAAHIRFLEQVGFQRAILARELCLDDIREIRQSTSIELEAFVHGSLCVGLSGRCFLSAALGGRSANRGACGQPCRLPWTVKTSDGRVFGQGRYPLSLKDMNRSAFLEDLIDAGVGAFKIEGRLKDEAYVKNVTAFYRTRIDAILEGRSDLGRASSGRTEFSFTPDPRKTFCRGATSYFLTREDDGIRSPDTPKSIGEEVGTITRCGTSWFSLAEGAGAVNAGDGLCFFGPGNALTGLQVARTAEDRVLVHLSPGGLRPGIKIFRNHDHLFLGQLAGKSSLRRLALHLVFCETREGFILQGRDEDGIQAEASLAMPREPAAKPQSALETLKKQLSRLGDSVYFLASLHIDAEPCFIRISEINRTRRDLIMALTDLRERSYSRPTRRRPIGREAVYPVSELDFSYNVSNQAAREFYRRHGVKSIEPAFELELPAPGSAVMTTRLCLREHLNACPRGKQPQALAEPLFLEHKGRRFRLAFDCRACRMHVLLDPFDSPR